MPKDNIKTVKIYFSEEDLEDMATSFHNERGGLWNTWIPVDENGTPVKVELWLEKEEED
jgi:hypothetical protein